MGVKLDNSNEEDDLSSAEADDGFGAGLVELVTGIKKFADTPSVFGISTGLNKIIPQNFGKAQSITQAKPLEIDREFANAQHAQLQVQNKNKQNERKMLVLKTQERLKKLAKRVMQPLKIVNKLMANDVAINNLADGPVANEHVVKTVAKNTITPAVGMSGIGFLALGSLTMRMVKDVHDLRWLLNEIKKMQTLLKRKKFEEDMQLYYEQTEKMTTFVLQMYKEYFDKLVDGLLQQKRELEAKVLQMLVAVSAAINIIQDIQATLADYKNFLADHLKAFENSNLSVDVKQVAISAIKMEQEFEATASSIVNEIENELLELVDEVRDIKDSVAAAITEVMPAAIINGQQTNQSDIQTPNTKVNTLQKAISEELQLGIDSITANLQKQAEELKNLTERKKELISRMYAAMDEKNNIKFQYYAKLLSELQNENAELLSAFAESKSAVAMLKGRVAAVKNASVEETNKLGVDVKLLAAEKIVGQISTLEAKEFAVDPTNVKPPGEDLAGNYSSKGEDKLHAIGDADIKVNTDVDCGDIPCLSESKGKANSTAGSDDEAKVSMIALISEFVDNAWVEFQDKLFEGSVSAEDEELVEQKIAELRGCLVKLNADGGNGGVFLEEYRSVLHETNDLCAVIGGILAIDMPLIENQNIGSKFMVVAEQYMETNAGLSDGTALNSKGVVFSETKKASLTCSR